MDPDLYFITVLERALAGPDLEKGAKAALDAIEAQGRAPHRQRGRRQFALFLEACRIAHARNNALEALLCEPLGLRADSGEYVPEHRTPHLIVWKDDTVLANVDLPERENRTRLTGLTPGRYRIHHDGGWLLWEGELTETQLLHAGESRPMLRVAAATGEPDSGHPAKAFAIVEGELAMNVEPGDESGSITFVYTGK